MRNRCWGIDLSDGAFVLIPLR